jgi:hypothetical protein
MEEYIINDKQTKIGDTVVFTDPMRGKHEATIKVLEPRNGSHHAILELSEDTSIIVSAHWFQELGGKFEDVPHHTQGVPYSWDHKEAPID